MRHEVRMNFPDQKGRGERQRAQEFIPVLQKQGLSEDEIRAKFQHVQPKPLNGVLDDVIDVFGDLNATRGTSAMGGPSMITFTEMKAYFDLTDQRLEPWEIMLLQVADTTHVSEVLRLMEDNK